MISRRSKPRWPGVGANARKASVPDGAVADGGGLVFLAGLLEGEVHEVAEILALDATSLLVAEYLAVRHEGAPLRARRDFASVVRTVAEWFPGRALSIDALLAAVAGVEVDSAAAVGLAESLHVPLVTKNREVSSDRTRCFAAKAARRFCLGAGAEPPSSGWSSQGRDGRWISPAAVERNPQASK